MVTVIFGHPLVINTGFLQGIFQGGKIYCYANFSIVFRPNFGGGVLGVPMEESQKNWCKTVVEKNKSE